MKKLIICAIAFLTMQSVHAQSDKYVNAMKTNIAMLDSIRSKNNALEIANNFTRIGDAEKDKWLPYYYAAYATAVQALTEQDVDKKDAIADKAASLLQKASDILKKDNSEIEVIKSMIATAHLMVDPASRFMSYGTESMSDLKKAQQMDPANPRPLLLQAESTFYTPETFGGGKDVAKPLFDSAAQLFTTFKPENELSPNWGKPELDYFLNMYK